MTDHPNVGQRPFSRSALGAAWPRPGHVRVRIGAPIRVEDYVAFEDAARKIEKDLRDLVLDTGSL